MLMAIDAGNTNIVFALYDGRDVLQSWRCKTDAGRTADEYASWLFPLFESAGLDFSKITDAIISSVVPDANFNLRRLCEKNFSCPVTMVKQDMDALGLTIKLNKPEEVGADRIVNAIAVSRHYKYPAIVVDFGTATTFDVVDGEGAYCGGVIAPGVNLSMAALHQAAAKLPRISITRPQSVIGRDTIGAMQSGIYWGYVAMVEGMIARIAREMDEKPYVVATGGLASLFAGGTDIIDKTDEDLTLKGLIAIHEQMKAAKAA
jgi:type III pantothenate kinase